MPLDDLAAFSPAPLLQNRDSRWLFALGHLQPDASAPQVQAQIDSAAAAMAREWPDTHKGRGARFRMLGEGNSEMRGLRIGATIAMGIIGLVLLLACFNVASLLLAQAVERERDMGIRASLGARPGRLMRLVVTEGLVLATMSGGLAPVLAWWTQSLVSSFAIPLDEPQHVNVAPDATVAGFIVLLVLIAGVLPGVWPAVAATRVNVLRVLSAQGGNAASGPALADSPLARGRAGCRIDGVSGPGVVVARVVRTHRLGRSRLRSGSPGRRPVRPVFARVLLGARRAIRRRPVASGWRVARCQRRRPCQPRALLHRLRRQNRRPACRRHLRCRRVPPLQHLCRRPWLLQDHGYPPCRGSRVHQPE